MDSSSIYVFQSVNYTSYDVSKRYAAGSSCLSHYIAPSGCFIRVNGRYSLDYKNRVPNCFSQGQRFLVSRNGNKNFSDADAFCGSGVVALDSVGNEMSLGYISDKSGQGRFQVFVNAVRIYNDNCNCGWGVYYKFNTQDSSRTYKGFTSTVGVIHVEKDEIVCTGVIVTHKYVLSSASCYFQSKENTAQTLQILTGYKEYPSDDDPFNLAAYQIESIKIHESYSSTDAAQLNDLAMIKTKDFIKFIRQVSPVCLPVAKSFTNEEFYIRKTFEIAGWTKYNNDGLQQFLKNSAVTYTTVQQCATSFTSFKMSDTKLCLNRFNATAIYPEYPGSSVFFTSGDKKFLIGMYNAQLNQPKTQPMVFTRISSYIPWIKANIGNDFVCSRYF